MFKTKAQNQVQLPTVLRLFLAMSKPNQHYIYEIISSDQIILSLNGSVLATLFSGYIGMLKCDQRYSEWCFETHYPITIIGGFNSLKNAVEYLVLTYKSEVEAHLLNIIPRKRSQPLSLQMAH